MKSIQNQYIDLKEGKMSQTNFMRNMRMSLPQYITNVTSFGDTVKILKNKGILSENKIEIKKGDIVSYTGSDKKYGEKILKKGTKGKILANIGGEFTVDFDDLGMNVLVGTSDLTPNNTESLNPSQDNDLPAIYRMYNSDAWVDAQKDAGDYGDEYDPGPGEDEDFERDYDADYEEPNEPFDMDELLNEEDYDLQRDLEGALGKYFSELDVAKYFNPNYDTLSPEEKYKADQKAQDIMDRIGKSSYYPKYTPKNKSFRNNSFLTSRRRRYESLDRSLLNPLKAADVVAKIKSTLNSENEAFKVLSDLMDKASIPSREAISAINDEDWAMEFITALKDKIDIDRYEEEEYDEEEAKEAERINMMVDQERENRFNESKSLREAKDEKGKWTNTDGKSMYGQFDEINIVNSQELLIGIDYEMVKNCDLSKEKATKIAIKKIKQIPNYYTMAGLAGMEGAKPEYIGGKSAQPEDRQMQYLDKNMGNVVDRAMAMKPVKDVEKFKKDSTTGGETNKVVKGVETTSFIAKTVRGVQKMNATGEKMKKIAMKEELNYSQSNLKLTPEETAKIKRVLPDAEFEWDEDDRKQVVYSNKSEREIRNIVNQATGQAPVPSNTIRPGIGDAIQNKLTKESLMKMIREEIKEITGAYGGDAMSAEDGSSYM
jgi:hypothetical protein